GIGQNQHAKPTCQRIAYHGDDFGIEKRLAASEPDFAGRQLQLCDFIEIRRDLRRADVLQPVVPRARFDVAIPALDVAERAGVDPQRLEPGQRNDSPALAGGSPVRVLELAYGTGAAGEGFLNEGHALPLIEQALQTTLARRHGATHSPPDQSCAIQAGRATYSCLECATRPRVSFIRPMRRSPRSPPNRPHPPLPRPRPPNPRRAPAPA